jgi:hypothetical protein
MAMMVIADEPADYQRWIAAQRENGAMPADPDAAAGRRLSGKSPVLLATRFAARLPQGTTGPDLTHVGSRQTIAAGLLETTRGSLAAWIADPQTLKPGNNMPMVPLTSDRAEKYLRLYGEPQMTIGMTSRTCAIRTWTMWSWTAGLHRPGRRRGIVGALSTVDHKIIGRRYIVTAFVFLALGGMLALAMRLQLAQPEARFIGPDRYNQIFTMHGTNMMFLFAVPVMEAMAVYLVPLMVGTRNIAFPRLNAFSYWMYLAGGLLLWIAFAVDTGPDVGWFAYVPLSGPQYAAGKRADIWAQMITFTEVSALAVAVEIVVTVFKQRAPGMSLDRIPLFVWSMLVTSFRHHHGDAGDHDRQHGADPRPAGRHAFLQSGRGRRRVAVAASVLVLRPSGGLHHLPAGRRHGLDDRRHLHATSGLRLPAMVMA